MKRLQSQRFLMKSSIFNTENHYVYENYMYIQIANMYTLIAVNIFHHIYMDFKSLFVEHFAAN